LTDFAQTIAIKKPIILKSRGESLRTYIPISDTMRGIFFAMLKGSPGEAYNVSCKDYIFSIFEMAKMFARFAGNNYEVIIDNNNTQKSNDAHFCIDGSKLETLGWYPSDDINRSIQQMIRASER
jgi:nucleoside-diphosphate-sugar epimerase